MRRLESLWLPYVLAVLAWCLYGAFTGSGPVGWVNLAQQSMFGAYWLKGSVLAAVLGLLVVGALLLASLKKVTGDLHAGAPTALVAAQPMSTPRLMGSVFAGLVALTWIVGLAACGWLVHEQRTDERAIYRPLTLSAGERPSVAQGERLALRAEALLDHALVRKSGDDVMEHLVPLAPPGWREGEPVAFVVAGAPPAQWPADTRSRGSRRASVATTLLVRVGGQVPVVPAHEFAKGGAPLDEHNHLLTVVPSHDGRPIANRTDYLQITLWSCTALSVLMIVLGALSLVVLRRQARTA